MDFLKELLGEELYAQVSEKLAGNDNVRLVNAADGSFVPKSKFDEERDKVKAYKQQVDAMNGQLTQLQNANADADGIRQQLQQLQNDIAAKDAEMQRQAREYRIRDAVRGSKAKNPEVVLRMIDQGKVTEDNGNLLGLADQLEALKKSDAYLFEADYSPNGGVDPNSERGGALGANFDVNQAIRAAAGR